jgi:uncharacterized damage-inducible protein DinB
LSAAQPPIATALSRGPAPSFGELAARYLEEYLAKIRFTVERLPAERLWWRPAPGTNSAGNLLLHLGGNLSCWLLDGIGGETYERDRAGEFAADGGAEAADLTARLAAVVERCAALLRTLRDEDLSAPRRIQGYDTDVRGAVFHAVEHMSYHTGQFLYLLKQSLAPGAEPVELYPQHRRE